MVAGIVVLVAAAHDAKRRGHGALARQQQLGLLPSGVGEQRCEGKKNRYSGIKQGPMAGPSAPFGSGRFTPPLYFSCILRKLQLPDACAIQPRRLLICSSDNPTSFRAILSPASRRRLHLAMSAHRINTIAIPVLVIFACVLVMACTATPPEQSHSSVTVEALLPTALATEPTPPQADTSTAESTSVEPPTDAPAPTDTAAPPTFTPRPLPTYTPRPVPQQATEADRPTGASFQAQLLDGTMLSLADTRGAPTLLAFWAPW